MSIAARKARPVILVAEDDEDILELVVFDLEDEGYEVLTARDGEQAITLALERQPDLVLLDVAMPGLDGYEVTRRLRAADSTRATPVVLLTARAQVKDVILGFEAGANDYVTKPFRPDELRTRLHAALGRR
jgi:two-component system, OmpR family, phosphate regulon response regulator PhoB